MLHKSLDKIKKNKKLNMYKKGIITYQQFINLIDENDPYMLIGPVIVAKEAVTEFLNEWKDGKKNINSFADSNIQISSKIISVDEIIKNLSIIEYNFKETIPLIREFTSKLQNAICKPCTKNRYVVALASVIHEHFNDGREYSDKDKSFLKRILDRYFPEEGSVNSIETFSDFDIEWIKPDIIKGLGTDLIEGLTNCFECSKKHLSRAKILWEEFNTKYPDHGVLSFNEFTKANKVIEEAFCLYWDSLGNLDQASCELIGGNDFVDLPHGFQLEMIELANKIRTQRINFQADSSYIPEWNKLRIEIQKLENKIKKYENSQKENKNEI